MDAGGGVIAQAGGLLSGLRRRPDYCVLRLHLSSPLTSNPKKTTKTQREAELLFWCATGYHGDRQQRAVMSLTGD